MSGNTEIVAILNSKSDERVGDKVVDKVRSSHTPLFPDLTVS